MFFGAVHMSNSNLEPFGHFKCSMNVLGSNFNIYKLVKLFREVYACAASQMH